MAKDSEGKARHLQGKIKEGVGDLLGDRKLKREGRLAQAEGEAEQDSARAEELLDEAQERETAARLARKRSENL
jgi:uncharacterized protein YjbJ (UPF0337 family)